MQTDHRCFASLQGKLTTDAIEFKFLLMKYYVPMHSAYVLEKLFFHV